jgi:putative molybdopterin biosynthesis protein
MNVYLRDVPLPEAQKRFISALQSVGSGGILGIESIPLDEHACGRVLAEPIWAKISSPNYHASAMDGFAVLAEDTAGAGPNTPVTLFVLHKPKTVYLDTGDPLPGWANAVIPIENVDSLDDQNTPAVNPRKPDVIRIRAAVSPWTHVRPLGEDIVATQLVLPAGQILRPVDLGAIAASGHERIHVTRRPRVAIIPTGSELVPLGTQLSEGEIIEFNSLVLAAQVNGWGGQATRFPVVPDVFEKIRANVLDAMRDHDLILLNAGSSAGSEDYSARVVEDLGDLLVHGVAVRPGHPVILGMLDTQDETLEGKTRAVSKIPIIGVPGYPVSAALTGELFVEPILARWLGRRSIAPLKMTAALTHKVTSPAGDDDYMRVILGRVGEKLLAAPLTRGAGVITSMVRADGLVVLPRGSQGEPAGAEVTVRLYRSPEEVEHTIFTVGSHDISLDILAQYLAIRDRRMVSANVGSQGGLLALRRGEAHIAGSHLLDPDSGEYNLTAIRQYLPDVPVRVVALAGRQQGLLIQQGNPKNIYGLNDLVRPQVSFINRQRGAGTRVLLDYQLSINGIAPENIRGYNQEEYTHLAVAAAVASGRVDCGLGIAAAAQALSLDFIPLFQERYDLVIPRIYAISELLAPVFDVLNDTDFKRTVADLPGYDITPMGTIIAEIG